MHLIEQAVLLCGGFGTRLRGMFPDVPKALVPVAGKPIIQRQIEWLLSLGVQHVHIAAGYKADAIKAWYEKTNALKDVVSISVEPEPLGTAGGTKFAISTFPKIDSYLVLNGDSLLPTLTLEPLISELKTPFSMTMAITETADASRYGTVDINAECLAVAFSEKNGEAKPGWINAGIYYLTHDLLLRIPDGQACSLEKDIFPVLADEHKIKCSTFRPPLLDMGTPEGLEAMTKFLVQ